MKTGAFFAAFFIILAILASTAGAEVRVNQHWHAYDPPPSSPPYGYYTYDPVTITEDTNWTAANSPYVLENTVTVASGVTLSIESGVTVQVVDNTGIYVNGNLQASSATFTRAPAGYYGSSGTGHWAGIYLAPTAGATVLNNSTISYAGAFASGYGLHVDPHGYWALASIYVDSSSPQITGCQITNSETHGISLYQSHATITSNTFQNMGGIYYPITFDTTDTFPVMSGNATSGTGQNGIALKSGDITSSGTWNRPGVSFPYLLNGSINVPAGISLAIDPGNTFKTLGDIGFYVNGTLNAPGSAPLPIIFTSRSATPAAGNWRGIYLAPTAVITAMSYVTIDYAGGYFAGYGLHVGAHGPWELAALYVDSISPNLPNLSILHSETNGLELYGASPTISNAQFANCGRNGLRGTLSSRPVINSAVFTSNGNSDSGYFTVSLDASSVPNPTGVTFSTNKKQGIEVRGGNLGTSALWKNWSANAPYALTGDMTVDAALTLNIEPSTTVKAGGTALFVYGILTANSTIGRITLTSLADDSIGGDTNGDGATSSPSAGNWRGIYLSPASGASVLNNCDINYSGAHNAGYGLYINPHAVGWAITAIYVDDCNPQITGSKIMNSQTHGISLWSSNATITGNTFQNMGVGWYPITFDTTDSFPVMSGNTTSGTGQNGIAITGGNFTASGVWNRPGASFPYLLNGSPTVTGGTTLIIDPGVTIKASGDIGFYVDGGLNVSGTVSLPITFTSRSDTPAAGNWRGIYMAPTATVPAISYVTIDYAGGYFSGFGLHVNPHAAGWVFGALYLDGISPPINNLSILHSETNGLELYSASPTISSAQFANCGWNGLRGSISSRPVINTAVFTSNGSNGSGYFTVSLDASSVPNPTGVTFSGNTKQGVEVRGGNLVTSATWKKWSANAPYALTGDMTVDAAQTLAIESGSTVKAWGTALFVNGVLTANSTSGRITFTSLADDAIDGDTNGNGAPDPTDLAAGNWRGIYLSPASGASILNNCDIKYSGAHNAGYGLHINPHAVGWAITAIYVDDCNPQITGSKIMNSQTHGISLWSSSATITGNTFQNMGVGWYPVTFDTTDTFPVMSGNTTSGTGQNGIAIPGGNFTASGVWNRPGASFPYLLNGSPSVPAGTSLTIDPGVTIKVLGGIGFYVYGGLNASGTASLPITFTSRSATPAAGNWRGVYMAPTATVTALSYVTIDYAGGYFSGYGLYVNPHAGGWVFGALYLDGISPAVSNLSILHSETDGLALYGASPAITNSRFDSCGWTQLKATVSSQPTVSGSQFIGATTNYGFTTDTTTPAINARNNYWGAASGPYDPSNDSGGWYNPSGAGVRVSDGIDYSQWGAGVNLTLTFNKIGASGGTVAFDPPGTTSTGNITVNYGTGSAVRLTATGDANSLFSGWSGACSGSGACNLTMDVSKSVTATFTYVKPARIQSPLQDFDTFALAYQSAGEGALIMLRDYIFTEPAVLFNRPVNVRVIGGYDTTFTSESGWAVINGLTIGLGSATVENLSIK